MGAVVPHCHEAACREAACRAFEAECDSPHGKKPRPRPRCWDASGEAVSRVGTEEEETECEDDDATLRRHFLSEAYAQGGDVDEIDAQDGGYALEAIDRVPVYRHEELDIRVWRQALWLAPDGETNVDVFFHYITLADFLEVAMSPFINLRVWASLKQACLESGLAVYAARREPAELAAAYCGKHGEGKLPQWLCEADHCIPLVVPTAAVFNADFPEDGCSPRGRLRRGRDLWTIRLPDEADALVAVAADNERRYRCVLQATESEFGPDHRETLDATSYLAYLLDSAGKQQEAEFLYRRAMSGFETTLGWDHPEALRCTSNLAALLQAQNRLEEAEPLARQALRGLEEKFGSQHPDTIANLGNLAHLLSSKGSREEAVELFRRVLVWREARLGPDHAETAAGATELAAALARMGELGEAVQMERTALHTRKRCLGLEHEDTLRSFRTLATLLLSKDDHLEAEEVLRESLGAHVAACGERHPATLSVASSLANLLGLSRSCDDSV